MEKYITFETKKNGKIEMSKDSFARWLCLMEIIDLTEKQANKLGLDLKNFDWVKPIAFEKYIQERFNGMMLDLDYDERNNLIGTRNVHYSQQPERHLVVSTVS